MSHLSMILWIAVMAVCGCFPPNASRRNRIIVFCVSIAACAIVMAEMKFGPALDSNNLKWGALLAVLIPLAFIVGRRQKFTQEQRNVRWLIFFGGIYASIVGFALMEAYIAAPAR